MTSADFHAYFAMKSDPEDVRMAGFAEPPDRERLRQWLGEELAKPDVVLLAAVAPQPREAIVGYVFLRRGGSEQREAEISYGVAASYRGRRLGQTMTALAADQARNLLPGVERAVCWVADDNPASIKNVIAAGYRNAGETRAARFASSMPHDRMMRKFVLEFDR